MSDLLFWISVLIPIVGLILFVLNRVKRYKNINSEEYELIKKSKKKLILELILINIIPVLICIIGVGFAIYKYNSRAPISYEENQIISIRYDYDKSDMIGDILSYISIGMLVHTILTIAFPKYVKITKKLDEASKSAMQKYYKGRGWYLIIFTLFCFWIIYLINLIVYPGGVLG